jgi:single-strand DNA-binding protein
MTDTISLTGIVGTDPRSIVTTEGLAITTFRLASTQRRFDKKEQKWVDGDTNWYTISTFRQLAANVTLSVKKGERVIVSGRVRIRAWDNGEKTGLNVDIEADAVGHDLAWGTTGFSRTLVSSSDPGADSADASAADAPAPESFPPAAPVESVDLATGEVSEFALDRDATPVPF